MTRRAPDRDAGAIALGFRVKSGRAIAVAMSGSPAAPAIVLRSEVALCDDRVAATRQPYHDGFGTAQADQHEIARLSAIVERCAHTSIASLLEAAGIAGRTCCGAALVVGSVIDPASVANPHIRAHANEGRLFRTVVERALEQHGITVDGDRGEGARRACCARIAAYRRADQTRRGHVRRGGRCAVASRRESRGNRGLDGAENVARRIGRTGP